MFEVLYLIIDFWFLIFTVQWSILVQCSTKNVHCPIAIQASVTLHSSSMVCHDVPSPYKYIVGDKSSAGKKLTKNCRHLQQAAGCCHNINFPPPTMVPTTILPLFSLHQCGNIEISPTTFPSCNMAMKTLQEMRNCPNEQRKGAILEIVFCANCLFCLICLYSQSCL